MTAPDTPAPLVSIITIFHNEERFLPEAVASVMSQTGVDWELLLVDDGSTDPSAAWARAQADTHPGRIRYLTHDGGVNKGMSATRNLGIEHARGTWLAFLDADDVWGNSKLERQFEILRSYPEIEVLVSPSLWWRTWDQDATTDEDDWLQSLGNSSTTVVEPPALLARYLDDEWSSLHDFIIQRHVANEVGGYEDTFGGMFEDQVFHAKVLADRPALVTEEWWHHYRQHQQATTAQTHASGGHDKARSVFLAWLETYLAKNHANLTAVRVQVRRGRQPYRFRTLWRVWRRLRKLAGRAV